MRSKTILFVGISLGFLVVIAVGSLYAARPYTFHGSQLNPPIPSDDFILINQSGGSFKLSNQPGKFLVLFFGYTHCPDICPSTLTEYAQIQKNLGDQAKDVQFIFITVDPERDTPEKLEDYLLFFSGDFMGLTGTLEDLEPVWSKFGVYHQKQEVGSASGYLVDHSTRTYILDGNRNLILTYPFGFDTKKITDDLRHLVK